MQNINPSRNITRRGRFYLYIGLLGLFGGLIAIVLAILFFFFPLWDAGWFSLLRLLMLVTGLVTVGLGVAGIVRGFTLQKDNRAAYEVGEVLERFMPDNRYTFLRNVSKRGVGYIDAVLVGPPGALVFRIMEEGGTWRNEHADWRIAKGGRLRPASENPTLECVRDVYALRKFLARHGLEQVPVYGIVVFHVHPPDALKLSGDGPVIPISETHTMYRVMSRDYLTDERIAPPVVRATVDAIIDG
jgi:hypothetical protein